MHGWALDQLCQMAVTVMKQAGSDVVCIQRWAYTVLHCASNIYWAENFLDSWCEYSVKFW
jgi:hypothetical protein